MNRRGFIGSILAAAAAPAIVRADSLMKIVVPRETRMLRVLVDYGQSNFVDHERFMFVSNLADVSGLPGFVPVCRYVRRVPVPLFDEIGSIDDYRVILPRI